MYLFQVAKRDVGRQRNGHIDELPKLLSIDEIRELCGLDKHAAALWVKVLEHVLYAAAGLRT